MWCSGRLGNVKLIKFKDIIPNPQTPFGKKIPGSPPVHFQSCSSFSYDTFTLLQTNQTPLTSLRLSVMRNIIHRRGFLKQK